MFHNISNPKWFGNWSRLEDDYLGNGGTDISVESHDCTSGRNALAADAPARDAPGKDNQNIG